ncbi:MAG: DciA family protein [Nitrospirota bacterium]
MRATDTLIPSLFAAFGLTAKLDEHRLISSWPQIVGPQIAAHTAPKEVRAKTLWVVVDSSTWLHELTLLKPLLLEKLAPHAGKAVVRDVRFVIGDVSRAPASDQNTAPAAAPLTPDEDEAVNRTVSAISDPDVRESARRLLRKAASAAPPDPDLIRRP